MNKTYLKLFIYDFYGHYMGGNGVVTAPSKTIALELIKGALNDEGLLDKNNKLDLSDIQELTTNVSHATILSNGDY